jgi:IPT/TIG domain-containing protein
MRRSLSLIALLFVSPLLAQVHEATPVEELLHQLHHGMLGTAKVDVLPAPVPEASTKVFDITVQNFFFSVTPDPFVVNEGDTVTLHITMANGAHGFFLENYVDPQLLTIGKTVTAQFVANTPGTFTYLCTNSGCGIGHGSMFGTFTVTGGAPSTTPTILTVSPATGSTAGGTTLTIKGTNFVAGATVKIGPFDATNVNVPDPTTVTAVTPLGPASENAGLPLDVTVTNPNGESAIARLSFSYFVPPPAITTMTPDKGSQNGGTSVTITGEGFTTAVVTTVTFGGVAATDVHVIDAVTLTATAPPHGAGAVDVVVTVGERKTTMPSGFTYDAARPKRRAARP